MIINPEKLEGVKLYMCKKPVMEYLVYECNIPVLSYDSKFYYFVRTHKLKYCVDNMPLKIKIKELVQELFAK